MFTSKRHDDARLGHLCSRGALFENVIVNCVYSSKGFSRDIGIWNADAERLLHTHNQLQRVDGIETQSIRTKKRQLIAAFWSGWTGSRFHRRVGAGCKYGEDVRRRRSKFRCRGKSPSNCKHNSRLHSRKARRSCIDVLTAHRRGAST